MSHIHTLKRVKLKNSKDIFMCSDPLCSWTRRREYLVGKKFLCPYCGNEYIATSDSLRRKVPHCVDCTVTKVTVTLPKLAQAIVNLSPLDRQHSDAICSKI